MTTKKNAPELPTSQDGDSQIASQPADGNAGGTLENTASVFSRLGISVDLDDDADAGAAGLGSRDTVPIPAETAPSGHIDGACGDDADDAVVAEYMQRLLGRSQGASSEATSPSSRTAGHRSNTSSARGRASKRPSPYASNPGPVPGTSAKPHDQAVRTLKKKRPAVAPETNFDLSAMRDLANLSARGALDAHLRQQLVEVTFTKLLLAVVSLVTGIGMVWYADLLGKYAIVGAGVCWTITVLWGAQYLSLVRVCYGGRSRENHTESANVDTPSAESTTVPSATTPDGEKSADVASAE